MRCCVYARYSSDLQRGESIEDQHRVAERLAERHGFTVVARYSDRAVSGGTARRPQYQAMLAAARRGEFKVIVAEDLKRLWREQAEQWRCIKELIDLNIAIVTVSGIDSRQPNFEIIASVYGASAELDRKETGYRTRRGLEGLARSGKSAGGRGFGYIPRAVSGTGQVEVDPAQAAVVVRVFELFAAGHSPRAIAATLNREDVPSPGSTWAREQRRKRGWVHTAIYGNPVRGLGILNNDGYRGVVIWNRSKWIRSAADSSKRRQVQNPRAEWIERREERLRIVSDELWQRVKARQAEQTRRIGEGVKRGLSKGAAIRAGSGSRYLLSGLLRCAHCGSAYAISGANRYACSGHTGGGDTLCSNNAILWRHVAEAEVTAGIKRDLLSPTVIEEVCRRARAALRSAGKTKAPNHSKRLTQLKAKVGNLADAIASGALRSSPALAARLTAAEQELEQLTTAQAAASARPSDVTKLLADLPRRAERAVIQLERTLAAGDIARARQEIRDHVGMVTIEADAHEIRLFGEHGVEATLVRVAGGSTHASIVGSGGRI